MNVKCLKVRPIRIITLSDVDFECVQLDGRSLKEKELNALIQNDGFAFIEEFFAFFDKRYSEETRANKLRLIQWVETEY